MRLVVGALCLLLLLAPASHAQVLPAIAEPDLGDPGSAFGADGSARDPPAEPFATNPGVLPVPGNAPSGDVCSVDDVRGSLPKFFAMRTPCSQLVHPRYDPSPDDLSSTPNPPSPPQPGEDPPVHVNATATGLVQETWDLEQTGQTPGEPAHPLPAGPTPANSEAGPLPPLQSAVREPHAFGVWPLAIGLTTGLALLVVFSWRFFSESAAALFSHVKHDEALAQPVRQRLLALIKGLPGCTVPDFVRILDMSRGNAVHHLDVLERNGLVTVHVVGRCRHYVAGSSQHWLQLAALKGDRARMVAGYVMAHPGCIQRDVAEGLGLPRSRTNGYVGRLLREGLLEGSPQGRAIQLRAAPMLESLWRMLDPASIADGIRT